MLYQRQKKVAHGLRSQSRKPYRFTPLLRDVRIKLGHDWTFYEECIDGVLDAAANQQDTTAWMEQMQQLVEGDEKLAFSHNGILFLLGEMHIQLPKEQSWGEGEGNFVGMYPSPPLSPKKLSTMQSSAYIDNMSPLLPSFSTMAALLPLRSNPRFVAPTSPAQQQQQQHHPNLLDPRMRVVPPFDVSASMLPSLTYPKNLRAFYYPPEQIIMTDNYVPSPPSPLRESSNDPIFFEDPALKRDIYDLFTSTQHAYDANNNGQRVYSKTSMHNKQHRMISFDPIHNDLLVWKKRMEGGESEQGNTEVKAATSGTNDTWPQWNMRFDLEL
jgi:hypothetical protein